VHQVTATVPSCASKLPVIVSPRLPSLLHGTSLTASTPFLYLPVELYFIIAIFLHEDYLASQSGHTSHPLLALRM